MTSQPWWRTDEYGRDEPIPQQFHDLAGPQGLALVKAYPDGRTSLGWGLIGPDGSDGFIKRYERGEFLHRRALHSYNKGLSAFAFVMRSVQIVCIDIDGKNGGFDHAKKLGPLVPTMAETSKSGDGYHLFYSYEEEWNPSQGFGLLSDRIGLEQGVDVRAVGCVYHYPTQRWNTRDIAPLPKQLHESLTHRAEKVAQQQERITVVLANNDSMEVLMMQDQILADLAKPIPAGKRNTTLFALGSQMQLAQIEDWDEKLLDRANEVGLSQEEAEKIVANIERYAVPTP